MIQFDKSMASKALKASTVVATINHCDIPYLGGPQAIFDILTLLALTL